MSGSPIPKKILILALALPVAALLGYMLAGPLDYTSIAVYGSILAVILLPLVIQHHHALLVLSLNASIDIFFLPGKPQLWMLVALVSLTATLVSRILNKEMRLLFVPSLTWALIAVVAVAAATAKLTGGLGMRVFGDTNYGGKRYVYILFALLVYLAVSLHKVPLAKARFYVGLYFLSTISAVASNLIYMAGPGMWWLYLFFPVDYAMGQAYEDFGIGIVGVKLARLGGFAPAAQAAFCFVLAQTGIRGLFDFTKPWRILVVLGTIALSLLAGFRSGVVLIGLILGFQFCLEGLVRTRLFAALALGGILGFAALVPMVQHLPLSIQRSLSILPLEVDAAVRADAQSSTEWRLQMWDLLLPEIPKYLWLGKGYTASATDYYLTDQSARRGLAKDYEMALLAGDYHNGPLSVILPFGVWGALAFLAFLIAAGRVLYVNYRDGAPALKSINTLLFAYFLAKLVYFFAVFGQVHVDVGLLAALAGLSVSLNGGLARKPVPVRGPSAQPTARPSVAPVRWRPART